MKVNDVIRNLSLYGGGTVSRAEAMATHMRASGTLPKGGRGPHAPEINEFQAVCLMLAVASCEKIADVDEDLALVLRLVDEAGEPLGLFLAKSLMNTPVDGVITADKIRSVRVILASKMAEVVLLADDDRTAIRKTKLFFLPESWAQPHFVPSAQSMGFVGRIGFIGGAVLAQTRIGFSGADDMKGCLVPE